MRLTHLVVGCLVPLALWILVSGLDDLFITLVFLCTRRRSFPWPSEADLDAARAENWPRLDAFAEYDTNSTSFLVNKDFTVTGFTFSMTLFSGGAQSAAVERRQKQVLQAQDQFLERQDNISLDVKQAYLAAGQTFDSVQVAEKNQQLAVENLRIYRDQYSQGLVTSTDVLTAEDAASRARSNYYQALYDYYTALARLDNVVGQSK